MLFGYYELGQPLSPQTESDPKQYRRFFNRLLTLIPTDNKKDFEVGSKIDSLINNFRERQKKLGDSLATLETNFKKSMRSV